MKKKNLDLTNPDHAKQIQDTLRAGARTEFWTLICQHLSLSAEALDMKMNDGKLNGYIAEAYKIEMEVLRREKANLQSMIDIPELIVDSLEPDPEVKEEDEVYDTAKDIELEENTK